MLQWLKKFLSFARTTFKVIEQSMGFDFIESFIIIN